ncbi:MAG: hypothetical protein HOL04_03130 [Gammaproteobacteria bacterium]|jgi:methyl-accepting chemotaxis protein|nr:hypothetical protein [Gammaproteobacteria bacterium]MBT4606750.1 hypothetical protein [Thiotrichales bacterium]MBT3471769.1 hypothetical protein [Gammaproteobacteria bacterium]MBT3967619.1 hypothetical protein [Gammaproteobacteria bacterium]MBT4081249.1 hypothetical protein [Gammaproteobacteria bacterium]
MSNSPEQVRMARSMYAQMCHFKEETKEQRKRSEQTTRKTAVLVQSIGTLLLLFVVVIGFYISTLSTEFITIVNNMERMNTKLVSMLSNVSRMKTDVSHMNDSVRHMQDVVTSMRYINHHVSGMRGEMKLITEDITVLDQLGEEAMHSIKAMNQRMTHINQNTGSMGVRMRQISKPVKNFPKP